MENKSYANFVATSALQQTLSLLQQSAPGVGLEVDIPTFFQAFSYIGADQLRIPTAPSILAISDTQNTSPAFFPDSSSQGSSSLDSSLDSSQNTQKAVNKILEEFSSVYSAKKAQIGKLRRQDQKGGFSCHSSMIKKVEVDLNLAAGMLSKEIQLATDGHKLNLPF